MTILFSQLTNQIIKLNYYFIIVNNYYNKNWHLKNLKYRLINIYCDFYNKFKPIKYIIKINFFMLLFL